MQSQVCVVVHAGAGYHSKFKESDYNKVCSEACLLAGRLLIEKQLNAIEAVSAAVAYLEDSPLTNAGIGSCLSLNGYVECDAAIMSGPHLRFAGVGAIRNVKNPIKLAKLLLESQINQPVGTLGRVHPCLLVGDGARQWAQSKGYGLDVTESNLVTEASQASWKKYHHWLKKVEGSKEALESSYFCPFDIKKPRLDTVGAVCVDASGNVASATSSGGIAMKQEGRIGQACIYGCGCWAEQMNSSKKVGVVTSGTGEQLMKTQLAQRSCERLFTSETSAPESIKTCLIDDFLNSKYLACDVERYAGLAGIHCQSTSSDRPVVEIFFGHTTRSMSVGHFVPTVMSKPKTSILRKRPENVIRMPKRNNPESPGDSLVGLSGDESQSSSLTTRKRRRLANASQLDLCQELFDRIRVYRGEDGSLSEAFMRLPSKRSNSDYYDAVREPIDLARIQAKIKASEYESVEQMTNDISLLVANTKAFYPASTTEFAKAVELQEVFDRERQALHALTAKSTASTTSSTSSSAIGRRSTRRHVIKNEERDDEETESLSIAASDDSRIAFSEASTTNLTSGSQPSSAHLDNPFELFFAAVVKYVTEEGRAIAPTFTYLPSKELYPVYYVVIKEPIDLRMIARRILSEAYNSMDDLEKDFSLLARNAKFFNEPKSLIYQDAIVLSRILKGKRSEAEHPPVRTNKERGKRASRLNYVPHEVVEEFASLPETPESPDRSAQLDESTEVAFELSTGDEDEDTRATGTSQSCSSVASTPVKRKRGRPPRVLKPEDSLRRSPSREPLSPESTPSQPSTVASHSMSSMVITSSMRYQRRLQKQLLQTILDATNVDGHLIFTPFFRLPSRRLYPDYYDEISNPLCLSEIKKRIKRYTYSSLESLLTDLDLVFTNAQHYNVEQSAIYRDSVTLQQLAHKKYDELLPLQMNTTIKPDMELTDSRDSTIMTTLSSNVSHDGSQVGPLDQTPLRRTGRRLMTPEETLVKKLHSLYKAVYGFRADDGHFPRDTFVVLPSKEQYPDYYEIITQPIDLSMIKRKIDENKYCSHQEMVSDLQLMFNNARHYNEEGSGVYNDAVILESVMKKRLKSLISPTTISNEKQSYQTGQFNTSYGNINSEQFVLANRGNIPINQQRSLPGQTTLPLLQRVMLELFQAIREYQINDRILSDPFVRLPTRSELPTYYEFIKKPIELQTVAKQLIHMQYNDFEEFTNDLFLMFDNACKFNESDSQIYADSLTLHRVCLAKRSMLLAATEQQLSIPPSVAPDVGTGIRRLLTNLHNAMLTACDPDGRGLVDSLIAGDGVESTLTSVTAARLAALHRAVAAGSYRRLDRLQSDWLSVLKRARIGEGEDQPSEVSNPSPTLQQRIDASELARRWVRLRDELCHRQVRRPLIQASLQNTESGSVLPSHLNLISPALSYTESALDRELAEENVSYKLETSGDEDEELIPPPLIDGERELQQIEEGGRIYRTGDFVFIEPLRPQISQSHIGRITRIFQRVSEKTEQSVGDNQTNNDELGSRLSESEVCPEGKQATTFVRVSMYFRPSEAHPSRRRRLLAAEVFRTAAAETVPVNKLIGHCLVVFISQFIRFRPKNFEDRDIFVCESHFSLKSRTFTKINNWNASLPFGIEFEPRSAPFVPTRLPPNEPLESALEQVPANLFVQMKYPLPKSFKSVVLEDLTETEGIVVFEQYVHDNGFLVKLGDFLYVPTSLGSPERNIVRVDRLWKSLKQNVILFTGPWFVFPISVDHLPTRLFYPKEVFLTGTEQATHALASATGKCYVMRPCDYALARPTEIPEQDVYMCDSKYFENEKVIRKLKKGLKKFQLSNQTHEDEFFFFPQPIAPRKEASPLLAQTSKEPLIQEQLNRPASTALASAIATASGLATSQINTPIMTMSSSGKLGEHSLNGLLSENSATNIATNSNNSLNGRTSIQGTIPTTSGSHSTSGAQLDSTSLLTDPSFDRTGKKRKLRKPPSGYVIYAGEVRKKLLQERPDAPFGEISREVGLLWRQMPMSQRDLYEQKAKIIRKHMEEEEIQVKAREQEQVQLQLQQQQQQQQQLTTDDKLPCAVTSLNISGSIPMHSGNMPTSASNLSHIAASSRLPVANAAPTAATMQFYQTPSGQVIQIVHATSTPGALVAHASNSTPVAAMTQPQTTNTLVQSNNLNQTSFTTIPAMASGCPVVTGSHQVVYQLANHQTNVLPANSIQTGTTQTPYYQQQLQQQPQRVLVASSICSTPQTATAVLGSVTHTQPGIPSGPTAGQALTNGQSAQIFLGSSGPASTGFSSTTQGSIISTATTQALPQSQIQTGLTVAAVAAAPTVQSVGPQLGTCAQEYVSHVQPQYQLIQQVPQAQTITQNNTAIASLPVGQNAQYVTPQPHALISQSQINRAPSPIFVSAPPRTSRVLHSEIYQRYINRLRKNSPGGISDWHSQLSSSNDSAHVLPAGIANQLAANFYSDPKHLELHSSVTEALWNLRDHLLEDALKIRVRSLGSVECL